MSHAPIPLYALSGFVGSGKTTALLGILKKYPEKRLASSSPSLPPISKKATISRLSVWTTALSSASAKKKPCRRRCNS